MSDTQSVISDVKLFIERLKKDLPEVFGTTSDNAETESGKILYQGRLLPVRIHLTPDQEEGVDFAGDSFDIYIQNPQTDVNAMAEKWLKEKAAEVLRAKTAQWAQKMGVEYNNIVVKDQQTLWASCSAKKNINYTYRIIKMPEAIRDYLIIHELSHLVHMNHGTEYWQLVAQFCPEYKNSRKWLNDNRGAIFANLDLKYIAQEEKPAE
ncbi:MAG: M48 family metallopeptidase [Elusimicrobiaceae bacterium]|nr:M48 family metallopeptidase [Elusimicrobiaceae bacterium]